MTRDELLARLREQKDWLAERGVENVRVYGSFARDQAHERSDVDLLVRITKPLGLQFFSIEIELGERLGRVVEMTTEDDMHRLVRSRALAEAVIV